MIEVMKSYTDLKQSAQLTILLPKESADQTWERIAIAGTNLDVPKEMQYWHNGNIPYIFNSKIGIPCWSLAALLDILPDEIQDHEGFYHLEMYKEGLKYCLVYTNVWGDENIIDTGYYESMVDACYQMIIKLHEEKFLQYDKY